MVGYNQANNALCMSVQKEILENINDIWDVYYLLLKPHDNLFHAFEESTDRNDAFTYQRSEDTREGHEQFDGIIKSS